MEMEVVSLCDKAITVTEKAIKTHEEQIVVLKQNLDMYRKIQERNKKSCHATI